MNFLKTTSWRCNLQTIKLPSFSVLPVFLVGLPMYKDIVTFQFGDIFIMPVRSLMSLDGHSPFWPPVPAKNYSTFWLQICLFWILFFFSFSFSSFLRSFHSIILLTNGIIQRSFAPGFSHWELYIQFSRIFYAVACITLISESFLVLLSIDYSIVQIRWMALWILKIQRCLEVSEYKWYTKWE